MRETTNYLKRSSSFYSFTKPSFIEGVARVLDLGGTLQAKISISSPMQADIEAVSHDWRMVGKDIENSINIYERKQPANAR